MDLKSGDKLLWWPEKWREGKIQERTRQWANFRCGQTFKKDIWLLSVNNYSLKSRDLPFFCSYAHISAVFAKKWRGGGAYTSLPPGSNGPDYNYMKIYPPKLSVVKLIAYFKKGNDNKNENTQIIY